MDSHTEGRMDKNTSSRVCWRASETALYVLRGKRVQAYIRILLRPKTALVETACFAITSFRFTEPDVCRKVCGAFLCMQTLRYYLTSYYLPAFHNINFRISAYVSCWRRNVTHPFYKALTCTNQNIIIVIKGVSKISNKFGCPTV